jgi:hypothetical protein
MSKTFAARRRPVRHNRHNIVDPLLQMDYRVLVSWLDRLVDEGKMKRGQRLLYEGKTIARKNVITDGPFGESKEVVGGYWFILANSLDEAARIATGNPCLDRGLFFEIRPIDPEPATPDNTR